MDTVENKIFYSLTCTSRFQSRWEMRSDMSGGFDKLLFLSRLSEVDPAASRVRYSVRMAKWSMKWLRGLGPSVQPPINFQCTTTEHIILYSDKPESHISAWQPERSLRRSRDEILNVTSTCVSRSKSNNIVYFCIIFRVIQVKRQKIWLSFWYKVSFCRVFVLL